MPAVALVVDDSMLIRYTVCRSLEERGFAVESATNGVEALQILERVHPDVIVTDMQMPKMSGGELITALKKNPADLQYSHHHCCRPRPAASTKQKNAPISPSIRISIFKASSKRRWMR